MRRSRRRFDARGTEVVRHDAADFVSVVRWFGKVSMEISREEVKCHPKNARSG
jgi:hypothetical protein